MHTPITPFEALMICHDKAGGQSALARALGCTQPTIWKMIQSAKRMSPEYVLRAEELFGVSCHDLRPDLYPRARFLGVDRAAPGYEGNGYVTFPAAYGAR